MPTQQNDVDKAQGKGPLGKFIKTRLIKESSRGNLGYSYSHSIRKYNIKGNIQGTTIQCSTMQDHLMYKKERRKGHIAESKKN